MNQSTLAAHLAELGLSDLEALTYIALVRGGPATAYSIGRQIGKPTANVYKAADGLEAKGAIVCAPGESRKLHPVPPEEFLSQFARRHADQIERAAAAFRKLAAAPVQSGLFQLESVEAVLERARRMLAGATDIAVIDCFPAGIEALKAEIEAATTRGVSTHVQAYSLCKVRCTSLSIVPDGAASLKHWKSEQINIVIDAREVLLALCTPGLSRVVEAYWSNSAYLACIQHAGLLREHAFHQIRELLSAGEATPRKLAAVFAASPLFYQRQVPGQADLAARVAAAGGDQ